MRSLLIVLFLLIGNSSFSQYTLSISGTFKDSGVPKPNEKIIVKYEKYLDSSNTFIFFAKDSAITDSVGFFSILKFIPTGIRIGYYDLILNDCEGGIQSQSDFFDYHNKTFVLNFVCPYTICKNQFIYNGTPNENIGVDIKYTAIKNYGQNHLVRWVFNSKEDTGFVINKYYDQKRLVNVYMISEFENCSYGYIKLVEINEDSIKCYANFKTLESLDLDSNKLSFTNSSLIDSNSKVYWNYGDGVVDSGLKVEHTYDKSDSYFICSTVLDSINSCYSTICKSMVVGNDVVKNCYANFSVLFANDPFSRSYYFLKLEAIKTKPNLRYKWYLNNLLVSSDSLFKYEFQSLKTFQICLRIEDSVANCSDSICYSIDVNDKLLQLPLGLQNSSTILTNIYPNPTSKELNIEVLGKTDEIYKIEIYNQLGQLVENSKDKLNEDGNRFSLDVTMLKPGVYIVNIVSKNSTIKKIFIKK